MPAFAWPAVMMPGQLGPMSRVGFSVHEGHHLQHVDGGNALGDADDERDTGVGRLHDGVGGKRRRHEDDAGVGAGLANGVVHLLKIGQPSWVVPPLPGVTPPTTFVPYAAAALAWNVPSRPVSPCTISLRVSIE